MGASKPYDVEASKAWFTSDLHFGHRNIIEYCQRPFTSVEWMDSAMVANWNTLVRPDDTVFVVGDFSLSRDKSYIRDLLDRLVGKIVLVRGNHDHRAALRLFQEVHDLLRVRVKDWRPTGQPASSPISLPPEELVGEQELVLCHYALEVWDRSHRGVWHLHGHSHGTLPSRGLRRMDVGVDCSGSFSPFSFHQIHNRLSQVPFTPVDGHKERA